MKIEGGCGLFLLLPPHWVRPVTCHTWGHWTSCWVLQVGADGRLSRRVWRRSEEEVERKSAPNLGFYLRPDMVLL